MSNFHTPFRQPIGWERGIFVGYVCRKDARALGLEDGPHGFFEPLNSHTADVVVDREGVRFKVSSILLIQ